MDRGGELTTTSPSAPKQTQSATGNNGNFDQDPDIKVSAGHSCRADPMMPTRHRQSFPVARPCRPPAIRAASGFCDKIGDKARPAAGQTPD